MQESNNEQTNNEQTTMGQPNIVPESSVEQPAMAQPEVVSAPSVEQPNMGQPNVIPGTVTEQPAIQPNIVSDPNMDQPAFRDDFPKKKHGKTIALVSIMVLLLAGAAGWYFLFYNNSPKKVFSSVIDNESKKILNIIESIDSESGDNLIGFIHKHDNLDVDFSSDVSLKINDKEIKAKSDIDVLLNTAAKKIKTTVDIDLNDKKFVNLNAILANSKLYCKLKDFSKYYYLDETIDFDKLYDSLNSTRDSKIIARKLLTHLQNTLNETIDESLITSSNEKITINSEEVAATKYTINITNELLTNIIKTYAEKIKNDSELISSLAKLLNISESSIKDDLNTEKVSVNLKEDIKLNYYVKNRDLVLVEITASNLSLTFSNYKSNYSLKSTVDNAVTTFDAIKTGDEYNVSLEVNGKKYLSGKVKIGKNDSTYNLELNLQEYGIATLSGSEKNKKDGNTFSVEGNVNIKYVLATFNAELSLGYTSKIGEGQEISDSEIQNAASVEDMSLEDKMVLNNWMASLNSLRLDSLFGYSDEDDDINYNSNYNYSDSNYNYSDNSVESSYGHTFETRKN